MAGIDARKHYFFFVQGIPMRLGCCDSAIATWASTLAAQTALPVALQLAHSAGSLLYPSGSREVNKTGSSPSVATWLL